MKKMEYETPMVEQLEARVEKGFQGSGASFYGNPSSEPSSGSPQSNTDFGGSGGQNYGGAIFY